MSNLSYNEALMRRKIDACFKTVNTIMEKSRASQIHAADEVPHQYADKFLLADTITNTMCASLVHCISLMGVSRENLMTLKAWPVEKSVTLSFRFTRKTTLLREEEREVESPTRVQETSEASGTSTISVTTKVKEFVYLEEQTHQLVAYTGVGDNEAVLAAAARSTREPTNQRIVRARATKMLTCPGCWVLYLRSVTGRASPSIVLTAPASLPWRTATPNKPETL